MQSAADDHCIIVFFEGWLVPQALRSEKHAEFPNLEVLAKCRLRQKPTGNFLWHMYLNKSKDKLVASIIRFAFVEINR